MWLCHIPMVNAVGVAHFWVTQMEHNCTSALPPMQDPPAPKTPILNCVPRAVITSWVSGHMTAALDFHLVFLGGWPLCVRSRRGRGSSPRPRVSQTRRFEQQAFSQLFVLPGRALLFLLWLL